MICGGLDIGGTKIEARLFDAGLTSIAVRRLPTPQGATAKFMDALADQVGWLREQAGADLPIGIALAAIIEPDSGIVHTANLPISGENIAALVRERTGRDLPVLNDSMAMAWSELNGGAADGAAVAVGLILGTGVAAGLCINGALAPRHGGVAVEIGHAGMPARVLLRHGLPLWRCGCGREGCIEAYVSGPGLSRLAAHAGLGPQSAMNIAAAAGAGEAAAMAVLDRWADLAGECLDMLQLTLAPEVVVLGGGLSQMPGVVDRLAGALSGRLLAGVAAPQIRLAQHGDSSGVRGAALLARRMAEAAA